MALFLPSLDVVAAKSRFSRTVAERWLKHDSPSDVRVAFPNRVAQRGAAPASLPRLANIDRGCLRCETPIGDQPHGRDGGVHDISSN
jgi:hypothetical protein